MLQKCEVSEADLNISFHVYVCMYVCIFLLFCGLPFHFQLQLTKKHRTAFISSGGEEKLHVIAAVLVLT